jgi:hypothetical protein
MAKTTPLNDFRAKRALLPDEVFLLSNGPRPGPTNLIAEDIWNGIIHLPDDVALTTSNHHGSQLEILYNLWGDWLKAVGDKHDELFFGMLDAADCFRASTFDLLHGYYRSSLSNLRSAFELVAIGALGNLSPADSDYIRWKKNNIGSLPFAGCIRKLRGATDAAVRKDVLRPNGWIESDYEALCAYAHSRSDSSDGEMWRSNGPIYVTEAFELVFRLQVSTYAGCYVFAKVGRPQLVPLLHSEFLFTSPEVTWLDEIASSYATLCRLR